MTQPKRTQQLLKILFGAAWIDGIIQPEERLYLHKKAQELGLEADPEIHTLLTELKSVQPTECYQWLQDYLGTNPKASDYQDLVEAISALIYSDSDIQTQEAQLLSKLQELDPALDPHPTILDKVLKNIQRLYRTAINEQL
jgi:hypothetical protein